VVVGGPLIVAASIWKYDRWTYERNLDQAQAFYEGQNEEDAIGLLERMIEKRPDSPEARALLGHFLTGKAGRQRESSLQITRAYRDRKDADLEWQRRIEGYWYLDSLDYASAIGSFGDLVQITPDADAYRQIAMAQANLGHPGEGLPAARQAAHLKPDDPHAVGLPALLLAESSQPTSALESLRALHGPVAEATYLKWPEAIAKVVGGDVDGALATLEAMHQDPTYPSYSELFQAQILLRRGGPGDLAKARELLEVGAERDKGKKFDRNLEMRRLLLAEIARREDDTETVEGRIRAFLGSEAKEPVAINLKLLRTAGVLAARAQLPDLAEQCLRPIEALKNRHPMGIQLVAWLQVRAEIALAQGHLAGLGNALDEAQETFGDPFFLTTSVTLRVARGDCDRARALAVRLESKPGQVVHDYFYPWVYVTDAITAARNCTSHPDASSPSPQPLLPPKSTPAEKTSRSR